MTNGHPVMRHEGKVQQVRRIWYERDKRMLLPGEVIRMQCRERLCVNTAHMLAEPRAKP